MARANPLCRFFTVLINIEIFFNFRKLFTDLQRLIDVDKLIRIKNNRRERFVRMGKKTIEMQIADYVMKYQDSHYRLAYSIVKNSYDAQDVVQESITKAFSSKKSLKEPDYIKTWFYRIEVNTALDFLRKRNKTVPSDEDMLAGQDSGEYDEYQNFDLQKALDELPVNYRSVVILRYFEDLKIEEVAEVLNENVNTVKTRLYKALQKLRITMSDVKED
jgi:RNA polymerase sigma-70 factor (ECF subfamily)